jgi:hypothetical protein
VADEIMIRASVASIASSVLAKHAASRQETAPASGAVQPATVRPAAQPSGLRQYQVLQSRSEPAQLTLKLGRR